MTSLVVLATPIGNLGDLSPRAAAALASADLVLAEDTRVSAHLLSRAGGHARLLSCHQHNEIDRVALVVDALAAGQRVVLVTDAGTPGISDPGARLVDAVARAGLPVDVVPGPSAITAALQGAGLVAHHFAFLGFLPQRTKRRLDVVTRAADLGLALVLFEAPQRTAATLADLHAALGPRRVLVARELTKLHQTFHRGLLGADLDPPLVARGEVVIVVESSDAKPSSPSLDLPPDASPRLRARALAARDGISVRDAYRRLLDDPSSFDSSSSSSSPSSSSSSSLPSPAHPDLLADSLRSLTHSLLAWHLSLGGAPPPPRLPTSGDPLLDDLLSLLDLQSPIPAPVELRAFLRSLLATYHTLHELRDAVAALEDTRTPRPHDS